MKRPIAYFAGTGRGIPATVMTNFDFATIGIETTDEWIVERTGIKERHIAKTESATDSPKTGEAGWKLTAVVVWITVLKTTSLPAPPV